MVIYHDERLYVSCHQSAYHEVNDFFVYSTALHLRVARIQWNDVQGQYIAYPNNMAVWTTEYLLSLTMALEQVNMQFRMDIRSIPIQE